MSIKKIVLALFATVGAGGAFGAYKFVFSGDLTDQQVTSYVKAYERMRKEMPEVATQMQSGGGAGSMMAGADKLDAIAKASGFSGAPELLKVNGKIAFAFSKLEGEAFVNSTADGQKAAHAQFDQALSDPNVPEEAKEKLRLAKASLDNGSGTNQQAAKVALDVAGFMVSEKDLEVVKRHQAELKAALTAH